jgi:hypothetical protein
MMNIFEIKYRFTGNRPETISDSNVDEMTLRYDLFLGSVSFKQGDKKIPMEWEWIPLLDFALCLSTICTQLDKQEKGKEIFEFTESDATLTFQREKDKCKISASFTDVVLTVNYNVFQKTVQLFRKEITTDILAQNEGMKFEEL